VVAIGASAGGLEALEQFLGQTPSNTGMAYIVVQHLDPTRDALLSRLLQRCTAMPVLEAKHGMRIKPDCVYVIAPNTELSVLDDNLNVSLPSEPRGLRLPVNVLFSSLASVQGERAIAVILSGMGSDGTLGMQAIQAMGGLTVAQEPTSAQFDSMPRSAIEAGCADIIAPAAELPLRILSYIHQVSDPLENVKAATPDASTSTPLELIIQLLRQHTRHDFSLYKYSTLDRRIGRRMAIHGLDSLALYAEFLKHNATEIELLFKELLIGVSNFFRDPDVWEYLAEIAIPELLARRPKEYQLRAWSIGCSTGEEAYSLAIIFSEALQRLPQPHKYIVQIFASDLSADAIAIARRGEYPYSIDTCVSLERLAHFFTRHEKHYQVNQSIRDMVLFAKHDVILDPPFTRLDLIACRNLLIYFDTQLQNRLLPLFHYSLRPGGLLLLGSSETVGRSKSLFSPVQNKLRIYLREQHASIRKPEFLLSSFPPLSKTNKEFHVIPPKAPGHVPDNLQTAADQILLQVYAPAAVILNKDGDIIYISGRTGKYLEPAAGKVNWNFHAMVRDGLRTPIIAAIRQSGTQTEPIQLHNLQIQTGERLLYVDVTVQALHEPAALQGMTMIVFRDITTLPIDKTSGKKAAADSTHTAEIQQYREEINTLREETRASREELQSANEELQSTNEELQSTNEELTTSKEEMQSMNEELQTINNELQTKLDDLALAQSDMKNILNSVEIAILFLDQNLNVRRYTDRASKIINLRESDIGRPLSDLTTSLHYTNLHQDALETLRTLVTSEKQITTDDNRWFSVRVIPYRRVDNMIDGVVITLVDITETKQLEERLRQEPKI
jgi:two-component system CheB/CheR fusion protein